MSVDCSGARKAPFGSAYGSDEPVTFIFTDGFVAGLHVWQIADAQQSGAVEGVKWCYGWTGPAVDALLAAEALR